MFFVFISILCCFAQNAEVIGNEWNGHLYEIILVPSGISWDSANSAAQAMGGHLVTITSPTENTFLYNLISKDDRYWTMGSWGSGFGPWIGLYRSGSGWEWVTGENTNYLNWEPDEPNDAYTNENWVAFAGRGAQAPARTLIGQNWDDLPDVRPKSFIIEYDFIPWQ